MRRRASRYSPLAQPQRHFAPVRAHVGRQLSADHTWPYHRCSERGALRRRGALLLSLAPRCHCSTTLLVPVPSTTLNMCRVICVAPHGTIRWRPLPWSGCCAGGDQLSGDERDHDGRHDPPVPRRRNPVNWRLIGGVRQLTRWSQRTPEVLCSEDVKVARPKRFELLTPRFVVSFYPIP